MTTTSTPPAAVPRARERRSAAGVVGDVLLWVASIGGVVCIIAVVAAVGFHITLIMFKTGSMEPTIPTGSLAVVHQIPASEVRVGDIVTVDRPGQLPVTHRVTSVSGSGEARTITLRGDANPTDDFSPYVVSTVRIVWTWFPGWASVVVWFSNPFVLGALTIGATGLVTWAFWPRDDGPGRRRRPRRRGSAGTARSVVTSTTMTLVAAALLTVGTTPEAARAADVETVVTSQYLELTSVGDPDLMSSMTPGGPVDWQVGVRAFPPQPGIVHLGLAAVGALVTPGRMTVAVRACAVRWVAGACTSGSALWLATTDLEAAVATPTAFGAREVGSIGSSSVVWLRMTMTMTAGAATPGTSAQLRLQAWGVGTPLSTGPGILAFTGPGASPLVPVALSVAAIAVGLLVSAVARQRRREEDA